MLQLIEKCGEAMKAEKLPSIDDICNQLEVAEYVDEIYQYYWVTEVMFNIIISVAVFLHLLLLLSYLI